jgi:predicted RNA binding protein YcfA (HicA-like mRNA interferase family)
MSKIQKLINSLLAEPPEIDFKSIKLVLENFDFMEIRSTGSHHVFRHEDGRMLVIPKAGGQKVKRVYIRKIITLLELI